MVAGRQPNAITSFFAATAGGMYDSLTFTNETVDGSKTYLEWEGKAFGKDVGGTTILTRDRAGLIQSTRRSKRLEAILFSSFFRLESLADMYATTLYCAASPLTSACERGASGSSYGGPLGAERLAGAADLRPHRRIGHLKRLLPFRVAIPVQPLTAPNPAAGEHPRMGQSILSRPARSTSRSRP